MTVYGRGYEQSKSKTAFQNIVIQCFVHFYWDGQVDLEQTGGKLKKGVRNNFWDSSIDYKELSIFIRVASPRTNLWPLGWKLQTHFWKLSVEPFQSVTPCNLFIFLFLTIACHQFVMCSAVCSWSWRFFFSFYLWCTHSSSTCLFCTYLTFCFSINSQLWKISVKEVSAWCFW